MPEQHDVSFKARVRRVFARSKLTMEGFAEILGISSTTINIWLLPENAARYRDPKVTQRRMIQLLDERPDLWKLIVRWHEDEVGDLPAPRSRAVSAALSDEDVATIIEKRKEGAGLRELAAKYGVAESKISRICNPPQKRQEAQQAPG